MSRPRALFNTRRAKDVFRDIVIPARNEIRDVRQRVVGEEYKVWQTWWNVSYKSRTTHAYFRNVEVRLASR